MTLNELLQAVAELSPDELRTLRTHIDERQRLLATAKPLDIEALDRAIAEIREGLTEEQLEEMTWAMNVEFVEPLGLSEWQN